MDTSQVQKTRLKLRKHFIETVLEEFNRGHMGLAVDAKRSKYEKMAENPYRFFRGSAYLFYYDVTRIPAIYHTSKKKPIWIQGDMHMDNFGCFQNEVGEIVFDANDFDEGYIGSYLYDVVRMAVSIALYSDTEGRSEKEQTHFIRHFLTSYYRQLERFAKGKDDPLTLTFTAKNTKKPIKKLLKKLEALQHNTFLTDVTFVDEQGKLGFCFTEEILPLKGTERQGVRTALKNHLQRLEKETLPYDETWTIVDVAEKIGSGTASIGLKRYYILIESESGKHVVIELKEARAPVPAYFLRYDEDFWNTYRHQGLRVIATQSAMHHLKDPFLGYVTMGGKEFYIRERSPYKKKVKAKHLKTKKDYETTLQTMGKVAAKIHARAERYAENLEKHSAEDILEAIDQISPFIDYVTYAAFLYKEQVKQDYTLFLELHNPK